MSLPDKPSPRHLTRLEMVPLRPAKAHLTECETDWRVAVGQAIERTWQLAGVTQKAAADAMHKDRAQVAKWENGVERPQFDAIFAVEAFRVPLVQALAQLAGIQTEVHLKLRVG